MRDGRAEDKGPFEGVPPHLFEPLRQWVDINFGRIPGLPEDLEGGPVLAAAQRYRVFPRDGFPPTVRELTCPCAVPNSFILLTWRFVLD